MFVLCTGYMIAALEPLSFGFLRDWRGGFLASWLLRFAVGVLMLAMTPLLKRDPAKLPLWRRQRGQDHARP